MVYIYIYTYGIGPKSRYLYIYIYPQKRWFTIGYKKEKKQITWKKKKNNLNPSF